MGSRVSTWQQLLLIKFVVFAMSLGATLISLNNATDALSYSVGSGLGDRLNLG